MNVVTHFKADCFRTLSFCIYCICRMFGYLHGPENNFNFLYLEQRFRNDRHRIYYSQGLFNFHLLLGGFEILLGALGFHRRASMSWIWWSLNPFNLLIHHISVPPTDAFVEYLVVATYMTFHLTMLIDIRDIRFICYPRTCSGECEPLKPENFEKNGKFEFCRSYELRQRQVLGLEKDHIINERFWTWIKVIPWFRLNNNIKSDNL